VISETRNEPFCQKQELLIDIKGYSNEVRASVKRSPSAKLCEEKEIT
jgi:hypothetical protein